MTTLSKRKTRLCFEVSSALRGRPLIVEAKPYYAVMREKGRRRRLEIPWDVIYWLAVKKEAERNFVMRKRK